MKKFLVAVTFVTVSVVFCKAQNHGSCNKAVLVDTADYGPVYADGKPNPLLAMQHTDGSYFEKPHSVVWFCIDIPYDTLLTFDLIPQNSSDDLDFLLFKDETAEIKSCGLCRVDRKNFCQRIALEKIIPVRTNIARADASIKGMTGLSTNAEHETEPPGKHPSYSKALEVKKGERYYLAVDNYTSAQRPFTLKLHFRFTNEINDSVSGKEIISRKKATRVFKGQFQVNVLDSVKNTSVKARIRITWINPARKSKNEITATQYSLALKKGQKININCYAKGFLISQRTYTAQTDSDAGIDIKLVPIQEHMKMIFKHMEFEKGEARFLPSAAESLNDLFEFMLNNPDVKILIKGYVNDPYSYYDEMFDLNLSKQRAEAVYNYLVDKGINKNRLQWRGYGNKEMVYAKPSNEDEMEANRRVEVEVVK